ncbi:MAG: HAD hydrolase-like protein [Planctomycetota bacterium]
MPRTMFLFDVDCTLVQSDGLASRVLHATAERLFDGALTYRRRCLAGQVDLALFQEAAELSGFTPGPGDHDRLIEAYTAALGQAVDAEPGAMRALPGTRELLADLHERVRAGNGEGPVLGCLTGNYAAAARIKLRAAGFDPDLFTVNAFGDEAATRPGLTELALRRYEAAHGQAADPQRVFVIGDTPHDIDCAHAHGCVAIAVATGRFSRQELEVAGADVVAADLTDPAVVLDCL